MVGAPVLDVKMRKDDPLIVSPRRRRQVLAVVAGLFLVLAVADWALVTYARSSIARGARWKGISFERGVSLVFVCDPRSGIDRTFFFLWPWRKVELEKRDPGA